MERVRVAVWRGIVSVVVALYGGVVSGGEVTVVGSLWDAQQPCGSDDIRLLAETPMLLPAPAGQPGAAIEPEGMSFAETCNADMQPGSMGGIPCKPRLFTYAQRTVQADWYARFDYFFWKEQADNADLLNEHGVLYTVGYKRSSRARRVRVELFTGTMQYIGGTWGGHDVTSTTSYLGARGEFDLIWDLNVNGRPVVSFFGGIGTRFWIRDIKDGWIEEIETYATGYQENWLTLYPYIGFEKKWQCRDCNEIFCSGRIGATAYTYEFASLAGAPPLNPQPCMTGQVELGLRHEHFLISAYFEAMTWARSPAVRGMYQPSSQMYTTGLKLGLSF